MVCMLDMQRSPGLLLKIAAALLQSRNSLAESRHGLLSADLNSKQSLASSSSSEQDTAEASCRLLSNGSEVSLPLLGYGCALEYGLSASCGTVLAMLQGRQHGTGSSREQRWGATYPAQISILFQRAMKTRRFDSLSTQDITQFILVGLLSGTEPCI